MKGHTPPMNASGTPIPSPTRRRGDDDDTRTAAQAIKRAGMDKGLTDDDDGGEDREERPRRRRAAEDSRMRFDRDEPRKQSSRKAARDDEDDDDEFEDPDDDDLEEADDEDDDEGFADDPDDDDEQEREEDDRRRRRHGDDDDDDDEVDQVDSDDDRSYRRARKRYAAAAQARDDAAATPPARDQQANKKDALDFELPDEKALTSLAEDIGGDSGKHLASLAKNLGVIRDQVKVLRGYATESFRRQASQMNAEANEFFRSMAKDGHARFYGKSAKTLSEYHDGNRAGAIKAASRIQNAAWAAGDHVEWKTALRLAHEEITGETRRARRRKVRPSERASRVRAEDRFDIDPANSSAEYARTGRRGGEADVESAARDIEKFARQRGVRF